MAIIWSERKNQILKSDRGISFEEVAQIILDEKYLAILENPSHSDQMIFVVWCRNYTYVVPFMIDDSENIILKTIFPSRKFHRLYGEKNYENKT